ncbi:MAG: hypothetical protein QOD14_2274, partial [Solirubrobacterales bacterium]|nr:hypothetical protein [Solirubrobacterales bacterium]
MARTASAGLIASCSRPARSYRRFFLHFFLAADAARLCLLHFFFFVGAGTGVGVVAPPPVVAHAVSVGATELLRGFGVVSEKSVALSFVSSLDSRRVGHPGA